MIDKNCFCEYNFTLCTKFHTGKTVLETLIGELNASDVHGKKKKIKMLSVGPYREKLWPRS